VEGGEGEGEAEGDNLQNWVFREIRSFARIKYEREKERLKIGRGGGCVRTRRKSIPSWLKWLRARRWRQRRENVAAIPSSVDIRPVGEAGWTHMLQMEVEEGTRAEPRGESALAQLRAVR
jgi:hypothetical protein